MTIKLAHANRPPTHSRLISRWCSALPLFLPALFICALNLGYAQTSGYYGLRSDATARVVEVNPQSGQLRWQAQTKPTSLTVVKTLSLDNHRMESWINVATIQPAGTSGSISVPIQEASPWVERDDAYLCFRPQIYRTDKLDIWFDALDAALQAAAEGSVDMLVGNLIGKVVQIPKAMGKVDTVTGYLKKGFGIVDIIADPTALDPYTKVTYFVGGADLQNNEIPCDTPVSFMVHCIPSTLVGADGINDHAIGIEIEKFIGPLVPWELFCTIPLLQDILYADLTVEHLLLSKQTVSFPPGNYRLRVKEHESGGEKTFMFAVRAGLVVQPQPPAGGQWWSHYDPPSALALDHDITAVAKSGWSFVRWQDGETRQTRTVALGNQCNTYVALFTRNDALVAHYPFDGDATDASGNDHHGTPSTPLAFSPGVHAQSADFAVGDPYVDLGPADQLLNCQRATFSLWAKFTEFSDGSHFMVSCYNGGFWEDGDIVIRQDKTTPIDSWDNGVVVQYGVGDDTGHSANFDARLEPGVWTHLAVVYDTTATDPDLRCRLFKNGSEVTTRHVTSSTADLGHPIGNTSANLLLGRCWGSWPMHGSLDEMRIYRKALSPAEILQLYNNP